jgi:hypothetical protein
MLKTLRYELGFPAARRRSPHVGAWAQPRVRSGAAGARPSGAHLRDQQSANEHRIVEGVGEGEHPAHGLPPGIAELARDTDRSVPTEDFLHPFALPLTEGVAGTPQSALLRDSNNRPPNPRDAH